MKRDGICQVRIAVIVRLRQQRVEMRIFVGEPREIGLQAWRRIRRIRRRFFATMPGSVGPSLGPSHCSCSGSRGGR